MAPPHQTTDRRRLKERVDYFFRTNARSRAEVAAFANRLGDLGEIAIVGGMLRNLSLEGNREFVSDVDFVLDCLSLPEFEQLMARLGAKMNRFGGFGIWLNQWKVDIWPLQRTWAAAQGHVRVKSIDDLLNATFFNWDEIIYNLNKQELVTPPQYFDWLSQRLLEINLEPNPNPLGNAIRAVRYAWRWNAMFGPRLTRHVYAQLFEHGWDKSIEYEKASFGHSILSQLNGAEVLSRLHAHERANSIDPVELGIRPRQTQLPFS